MDKKFLVISLAVSLLFLAALAGLYGVSRLSEERTYSRAGATASVEAQSEEKAAPAPLPEAEESPAPAAQAPPPDPAQDDAPAVSGSGTAPSITSRLLPAGFASHPSPRAIDTIVIHSSFDAEGNDPYSVSGVIKEYEDAGVSAHYLIDRNGRIYQLVKEKDIAYHAGVSRMPDGRQNVNAFSLGIEIITRTDTQVTDKQYAALNALVGWIKSRYPIRSVVGHSDIAPGRKTDPWNFDWKKLK